MRRKQTQREINAGVHKMVNELALAKVELARKYVERCRGEAKVLILLKDEYKSGLWDTLAPALYKNISPEEALLFLQVATKTLLKEGVNWLRSFWTNGIQDSGEWREQGFIPSCGEPGYHSKPPVG